MEKINVNIDGKNKTLFATGIVFNRTRVKKPRRWQVTIVSTYVIDVIADSVVRAEETALASFNNEEYRKESCVVNICQIKED